MRIVNAEEDSEFRQWLLTEYRPIAGGDGSEEGENSEGEGNQGQGNESAQDQGSQSEGAEGERDEKGVPLKNRLAEERRKREKAEMEAHKASIRADAYERSMDAQRKEPDTTDDEDDTLLLTNPKAYREKLKNEVFQEVGKVRQEAQMKELLDQYPELKDKDSEEFQAVNRRYEELVRDMGVNNIGVLKTAAEIVYAKRPKKKDESRLTEPLGSGGSLSSQRGKRAEITPERRKMMKGLGITDEKRMVEIYSRDYSDEIRAGG